MEIKPQNAVLVGIQLPRNSTEELEASLQELSRLVTTLGYSVVGQVTQRRSSDRSAVILGSGKLKQLALWTGGTGVVSNVVEHKLSKAAEKWKKEKAAADAEDASLHDPSLSGEDDPGDIEDPGHQGDVDHIEDVHQGSADIVIVDIDLSPSQIRNLESATGVTVLDRTGVIIEIFSRHARTKAARLQVEIARLNYVAPRLRETGGGEDRQGGGIGGKGAGESSLELDKRKIRDRIKELKTELAGIGNEQQTRRARRETENTVALVGYTNAGKSSLMRALTGSEVLVADKLFATLDTTIRPMHPETLPKVLISDTVGFIKKLPHDLVASFKSTLDEALNASLLIFVVDSSDISFRSQLEVTRSVLNEVGAIDIPSFLILNKRDRVDEATLESLSQEFPEAIQLCTRQKDDIKQLRDKILSYFEKEMTDEDLFVPYTTQGAIGEIRHKMRVLTESYDEQGTHLKVRCAPLLLQQVKKKFSL